jgi:hypothetical protein
MGKPLPEVIFVPPYLQNLGYAELPEMRELAVRAQTITDKVILGDPLWFRWRGILDYVCCVEYARQNIKALPSGSALGSVDQVPARYHSISLVFFAQATLDNIAVWICDRLNISLTGSDRSFHKAKLKAKLLSYAPSLAAVTIKHAAYFAKLDNYRKHWIHFLTGGAAFYSDKNPGLPNVRIGVMIPINPAVFLYTDQAAFSKAVERTRTNNGGEWLYPIADFADEFAGGLKDFLIEFLGAMLRERKVDSSDSGGSHAG